MDEPLDREIRARAKALLPAAVELLAELVGVPRAHVRRPAEEGGDPACGLSNHEGPRLELLRRRVIELGGVDRPEDVGFDAFGNLRWRVWDPEDGVEEEDRVVIFLDGHTDTVAALAERWREALDGAVDPYDGLVDPDRLDEARVRRELGYLPPADEWSHLLWGRGSADQLGGVVCQVFASRILRELRPQGSLAGVVVESIASVAEEDNDGGGPHYVLHRELRGAAGHRLPDLVVLTEGTGCAEQGALGIYRGQRGRMQIEVEVTGRSCHGSMPWRGLNPLEHGGAILAEAAEQAASGKGFAEDEFLGAGTRTASWARLETPSDCAVPERFTFRLDRRLTAGEDPELARSAIADLSSVARARAAGLTVEVRIPVYEQPTWRGFRPGNDQIYPGWVTPESHPAVQAAVEAYERVVSPEIQPGGTGGALRREPRVSRWVFSTDGVGVPLRRDDPDYDVPATKRWVEAGPFHHPAMLGIGPGIEQNTHAIGECVDTREIAQAIAVLARLPSLYRRRLDPSPPD